MLNEEEYAKACELYSEAIRNTNGEEDRLIRYKALIDYYKEITGWDETEPNAIMHHRIEQYGSLCENCGKPYRIPLASFCAGCGQKKT